MPAPRPAASSTLASYSAAVSASSPRHAARNSWAWRSGTAPLRLPIASGHPLQQLDRADLAAIAAIGLTDPARLAGRRIEVAGDAPTPTQMAEAFTRVLGQEVRHVRDDLAMIRNPDMHAMWTFLARDGYQADLVALRAEFPEIAWTRFADWVGRTLTPQS
ncbi:NmrA family NAD(P)-binding protein [Actinomycetospora sp. NBC_00405]|uniref:NmrA family NAD(P)-binding protein n=1 Tax=Actinomycetospora sp. NBC_00405 TaxID=2975952 RepID=UPI002E23E467